MPAIWNPAWSTMVLILSRHSRSLRGCVRWESSVGSLGALAGDVEIIAGNDARTVRTDGFAPGGNTALIVAACSETKEAESSSKEREA